MHEATDYEIAEAARLLEHNELHFQSRTTRDRVWAALPAEAKLVMRRRKVAGQIIDPRYTWEGRMLPDLGMANNSICCDLYSIECKV